MRVIRNFVAFEGGDGSGKSTQLRLLSRIFSSRPELPPLHPTFEPTDGPVGRFIRSALRREPPLQPETLARLFAADRNEHLYGHDGILARIERGELVVCDRYILSSLIYQGITCGKDLPRELNKSFPLPEALVFFDLDPCLAVRRLGTRAERDPYETVAFQAQVREAYCAALPGYAAAGVRVAVLDASAPEEEVAAALWREMRKLPILGAW
ncbi:MAG: dTMP kinase [Spirochaetaceae bacterium]|nr:dTMP kinase [Spirochaetaceae bacterium]